MRPTELKQEIRKMRFEEAYEGWKENRLTQEEAGRLLGVSDRTFRRYLIGYEADGLDGILDRRLSGDSHRRAPVDEVTVLTTLYRSHHLGWNVKYFYGFYKRKEGLRSYSWVKQRLQKAGVVKKEVQKGGHRKRRERAPIPGMLLHQDGSTHEWVLGQLWDLIVTMDDATSEHYSMFFVEEEGTRSSFRGMSETIEKKGLGCSLYTDRGSHYWWTPKEGGPVDKGQYTQFRRGMEILCEQYERKVGRDNCVHFEGRVLQIPSDRYRCHYVSATVRVLLYGDGRVALFHGPRKLVEYDEKGEAVLDWEKAA
jgi:hypothetical protein